MFHFRSTVTDTYMDVDLSSEVCERNDYFILNKNINYSRSIGSKKHHLKNHVIIRTCPLRIFSKTVYIYRQHRGFAHYKIPKSVFKSLIKILMFTYFHYSVKSVRNIVSGFYKELEQYLKDRNQLSFVKVNKTSYNVVPFKNKGTCYIPSGKYDVNSNQYDYYYTIVREKAKDEEITNERLELKGLIKRFNSILSSNVVLSEKNESCYSMVENIYHELDFISFVKFINDNFRSIEGSSILMPIILEVFEESNILYYMFKLTGNKELFVESLQPDIVDYSGVVGLLDFIKNIDKTNPLLFAIPRNNNNRKRKS